jgi:isoamylase
MLVSQGVPMLAHGDELGRTQGGNNNVYAQDNPTAWVDWDLNADQRALLEFTSAAIALRRAHPVLRRRRFFAGDASHGGQSPLGDIVWLKPDGGEMSDSDWGTGYSQSLMVFLNGDAIPEADNLGRRITDDHFLLMFNASSESITFTTPAKAYGEVWTVRLNTATGAVDPDAKPWRSRGKHSVPAHSMVVLSTTVVPESARLEAEQRADEARPTQARISGQA